MSDKVKRTTDLPCATILKELKEAKSRVKRLTAQVEEYRELSRRKEFHIQDGKRKLGEERKKVDMLELEVERLKRSSFRGLFRRLTGLE